MQPTPGKSVHGEGLVLKSESPKRESLKIPFAQCFLRPKSKALPLLQEWDGFYSCLDSLGWGQGSPKGRREKGDWDSLVRPQIVTITM